MQPSLPIGTVTVLFLVANRGIRDSQKGYMTSGAFRIQGGGWKGKEKGILRVRLSLRPRNVLSSVHAFVGYYMALRV